MKLKKQILILFIAMPLSVSTAPATKEIKTVNDVRSLVEEAEINAWIDANKKKLNLYGDPIGTTYPSKDKNPYISPTGGFIQIKDPVSGISRPMTIYEYIQARHPEKPWKTASPFSITALPVRSGDKTECIQICTIKS